MSRDVTDKILCEIDSRIDRLKEHTKDEIHVSGNQYEVLNQAISKVIGTALLGELEGLKTYIKDLQ